MPKGNPGGYQGATKGGDGIRPGLRRRMEEFQEVEDLPPISRLRRQREAALNRQRNVAEGKPALAPRKKRG